MRLEEAGAADEDGVAADGGGDASAGDARKSTASSTGELAGLGDLAHDRVGKGMLGAALRGGDQGEDLLLGKGGLGADDVRHPGLPLGEGPVLSRTTAFTEPSRSRASALRNRIPFSAPLPVPTMIEVGVARPSAQGRR